MELVDNLILTFYITNILYKIYRKKASEYTFLLSTFYCGQACGRVFITKQKIVKLFIFFLFVLFLETVF